MTVLPGLLAVAAMAVVLPFTGGGKEFVASVRSADTGAHLCEATVVSPEWVVSSAQCLEAYDPAQLTVRISVRRGSGSGATVGVSERITHPDHDIALARLNVSVSTNPAVPAAVDPHRDWIARHVSREQ